MKQEGTAENVTKSFEVMGKKLCKKGFRLNILLAIFGKLIFATIYVSLDRDQLDCSECSNVGILSVELLQREQLS